LFLAFETFCAGLELSNGGGCALFFGLKRASVDFEGVCPDWTGRPSSKLISCR